MSLVKAAGLTGLLLGALLLSLRTAAEPSRQGVRQSLGPPRAPHAMPGGDGERSHRSAVKLSPVPHVERRLRVAYGVGRGLLTFDDGGFFVLHPSARASRFDAQGKLLYSVKLAGEPSSPAVLTSNGSSAFVAAGELQQLDDAGKLRSHTALGDADFKARSILATRDGSVVVASNSALVKVSAFGELVWRKSSPETALELLETRAGLVLVTVPGSVYRLDNSGRMSKLGEFDATTQSVTASGNLLLARTGPHRLVSFELGEHRPRTSIEDGTLELDGPVLLTADRIAQVFTSDGLLVRYRADGSEAQRVPIDPGSRKAPGNDDALLLADGRLLVARTGADVAVVSPAGEVSTIATSACPDPVGVFAAGPSATLVACRSGNMLRLE